MPLESEAKKVPQHIIPITLALFAVGVLLFALRAKWGGLNLSVNPTNVAMVLAPLTLAAGFIERAVEVIISPLRDKDADRLESAKKIATKRAEFSAIQATASTAAVAATPGLPDVVALAQESTVVAHTAISNVSAAADVLAEYKGKTKQYAYSVSLLLSFLVAFVGIRALNNLRDLNTPSLLTGNQALMFNTVDVIVTAAMLAGGANGIHSVVTAFTSFFDASAQKSQQP